MLGGLQHDSEGGWTWDPVTGTMIMAGSLGALAGIGRGVNTLSTKKPGIHYLASPSKVLPYGMGEKFMVNPLTSPLSTLMGNRTAAPYRDEEGF